MTTDIASQITRTSLFHVASIAVLAVMLKISSAAANAAANRFNMAAIYSDIAKSEYDINWQPHAAAYQCPNRANNLRFTIHKDGFSAERRAPEDIADNWKANLTLTAYGSRNPLVSLAESEVVMSKNRGTLTTDEVVFEYRNETNGLHQSFLVKQRPVEGNLFLDLAVTVEGLSTFLDDTQTSVVFIRDDTGEAVMEYADLLAFDAEGRQLPAAMQVSEGHILLLVDDTNATYPVLVDPWTRVRTLQQPDPIQSGASFGFSVAYLEVAHGALAIGAPWFDDGLTDQGKVFVFTRTLKMDFATYRAGGPKATQLSPISATASQRRTILGMDFQRHSTTTRLVILPSDSRRTYPERGGYLFGMAYQIRTQRSERRSARATGWPTKSSLAARLAEGLDLVWQSGMLQETFFRI